MDNNETTTIKKNKSKSGILWFVLFILIVLFVGIFANKDTMEESLGCEGAQNCVRTFLAGEGSEPADVKEILRNEIVKEESTVIDVIDEVSPAVVSIVVKTVGFDVFSGPFSVEDGIGTGFIVDSSGIIVTNSHVVDDLNAEYSVVLKDGTAYEVERIHLDQPTDLAILEITAADLPTVDLGDSDDLKVGQVAIAIGNALGTYDNTVTVGVVSGIARELTATSAFGNDPKTYESVIQTDAALNPGNSGGPLLNSASQVIGINVATTRGADNIGFSIPVNTLKPLLETFLEEGRIVRPYMGIAYRIITEDLANVRRLPQGAFVTRVLPDSPADKAGLERGDIIVMVNDKQVNPDNSISRIVNDSKVGEELTVLVDRGGEEIELVVVLEEAPGAL